MTVGDSNRNAEWQCFPHRQMLVCTVTWVEGPTAIRMEGETIHLTGTERQRISRINVRGVYLSLY